MAVRTSNHGIIVSGGSLVATTIAVGNSARAVTSSADAVTPSVDTPPAGTAPHAFASARNDVVHALARALPARNHLLAVAREARIGDEEIDTSGAPLDRWDRLVSAAVGRGVVLDVLKGAERMGMSAAELERLLARIATEGI